MSGIFPASWDGGIPPNPPTPDNPAQAFKPRPAAQPTDTSALYYGNGCDFRVRAPVLNSLISEVISTCDRAGVAYEAASLRNLLEAICMLGGWFGMLERKTPFFYAVALDPPPQRYRNFMRLTLVPDEQNVGQVRINANGLGDVPLLRNNGAELIAGDLRQNMPFTCCFFGEDPSPDALRTRAPPAGSFYYIGKTPQQ